MEIDESKILGEYPNEELALACLLASGWCFLNNVNISKTGEIPEYNVVVYVLANDIFAWGCADAETIKSNEDEGSSEIIELYKLWKENPTNGPIKWLCLKRNEQPQKPIKEMMIKDNYWDDVLENLPANYYDDYCKKEYENKKQD